MKTTWKTASVFISSTFRDMHSERDILVKRVFPKIREKLLPYRIKLIDIDLRWGITQEQSENEKTIEFCLDSIDNCRPFFVGILGERYGWIPAPYPHSITARFPDLVKDNGTSITALEIIHGVFKEKRDNAVFFFRDSAFANSVPDRFKNIICAESDIHREKQNTLKNIIRNQKLVYPLFEDYPCNFAGLSIDWELLAEGAPSYIAEYMKANSNNGIIPKENITNASEEVNSWLQQNAIITLDGMEVFADKVYEAIWAMLANAYPEIEKSSVVNVDNNLLVDNEHSSFADELSSSFIGRKKLRDEFSRITGGELLVYTGPTGSGKSALMASLVSQWQHNNPEGDSIIHFAGSGSQSNSADIFFARLYRLICVLADVQEPEVVDPNLVPNSIRKVIEQLNKNKKLIIAIDDLDLIFGDKGFDLRWLPSVIPENITIVISVCDDRHEAEKNLKQLTGFGARFIQIPMLRENERTEIIKQIPALWAKALDDNQIKLLSQHPAANNPLFLTIALEELRKFGSFERLERKIKQFPQYTGKQGLTDMYKQMLHRLERELGLSNIVAPLCLLACSKTGLKESEINNICVDVDNELIAQLWRELRVHINNSNGLLSYYHLSLKQAVEELYLSQNHDISKYHLLLADFFKKYPDKVRALPELLEHYYVIGDTIAMTDLLCNLKNYLVMRKQFPSLLKESFNRLNIAKPSLLLHQALCQQIKGYDKIINSQEGVALSFWQPSDTKEILLYDGDNDKYITPILDDWQHDVIIELVRYVNETAMFTADNFFIVLKSLAILEAELGPAHARTLEALSVALPLLTPNIDKSDVSGYLMRALMMSNMYLNQNHPVNLKIHMHVQDINRETDPENNSFIDDFAELGSLFHSDADNSEIRELPQDIPIRESQRNELWAFLLIRHSQMLRTTNSSDEAFEYCKKATDFCVTNLGNAHQYTILAKSNLASFFSEVLNDRKKGNILLKEALTDIDKLLGTHSFIGLTLLNNLSVSYGNNGEFDDGLPFYREVVDRKKQIYGETNESTLHSIYNLAWCLKNLKQYAEALELVRKVVAGFESLGDDYKSDYVTMQYHRVEIMEESGDFDNAAILFEKLYTGFMEDYDNNDWYNFFALNTKLAEWLINEGEHNEAVNVYKNVIDQLVNVEGAKKYLDESLYYYSMVMRKIIDKAEKTNNLDEKIVRLQDLIMTYLEIYPDGHPDILEMQFEYGKALNNAGKYEDAEGMLRLCYEQFEITKGRDDPQTRITASILSDTLMKLGKTEEAGAILTESIKAGAARKTDTLSMLERIIGDKEEKFGVNHPETIKSFSESADILADEGKYEAAVKYYQQAITRAEITYGPIALETIFIAERLSQLYLSSEKYAEAEPLLRRITDVFERSKDVPVEHKIGTMVVHSDILMAIEEDDEASAVLKKALSVCEHKFGKLALITLEIIIKLVIVNRKLDNKDNASAYYQDFVNRLNDICSEESIKKIVNSYLLQKDKLYNERISRGIDVIKEMKKQGKMENVGNSAQELKEMAQTMTQNEVKVDAPEGADDLIKWTVLFSKLDPDEKSMLLWSNFCENFETLIDDDDPAKYLPGFSCAKWLAHYDAHEIVVNVLIKIFEAGNLTHYFVQQSGIQLFKSAAAVYDIQDVINLSDNLISNYNDVLGDKHPSLNFLMNEVAAFLLSKEKYKEAENMYIKLLENLREVLEDDHPFVQEVIQKLNTIKNIS